MLTKEQQQRYWVEQIRKLNEDRYREIRLATLHIQDKYDHFLTFAQEQLDKVSTENPLQRKFNLDTPTPSNEN